MIRLPAELMYWIPFLSRKDRITTLKHFVTQSFSSDDSDKSQVLSLFCRKSTLIVRHMKNATCFSI